MHTVAESTIKVIDSAILLKPDHESGVKLFELNLSVLSVLVTT